MSFEREIVEQEIFRLEAEKAALLRQQQEYSASAVAKHQADHNAAIAALITAKGLAGAKAKSVLQARIDKLTADRDAVKVQDFGTQISDLSQAIGELRQLLEVL